MGHSVVNETKTVSSRPAVLWGEQITWEPRCQSTRCFQGSLLSRWYYVILFVPVYSLDTKSDSVPQNSQTLSVTHPRSHRPEKQCLMGDLPPKGLTGD